MSEYDTQFQTELPLAQGDVFAWPHRLAIDEWKEFGVIITADCDIVHRGLQFLTYLPILRVKPYLEQIWAKQRIERLLFSHQRSLIEIIHRYHLRLNPSAQQLDAAAIDKWVLSSPDSQIVASLDLKDDKEIKNLSKMLEVYRRAVQANSNTIHSERIRSYCDVRAHKADISIEKMVDTVSREAHSDIGRNIPLECFFLSSLPQIDDLGFVVMLRHIQPITFQQITNSFAEMQASDRAYRLGRLSPTFKYALTQKFANLFARIGLPGENESWNDAVVEDRCSTIIKEANGRSAK